MVPITICDNCESNLMGDDHYRSRYITLTVYKCKSPYIGKEADEPDMHFCGEGCLKSYFSNITISTGSFDTTIRKSTLREGRRETDGKCISYSGEKRY